MFAGEKINTTEGRMVYHPALRCPKTKAMVVDGVDIVQEVHAVLDAMADFSERVRNGTWLGSTGKKLTSVVAVGIGGSALGPEFLSEALKTDPAGSVAAEGRTLKFLANVDPVDFKRTTTGLDPEVRTRTHPPTCPRPFASLPTRPPTYLFHLSTSPPTHHVRTGAIL